MDCVKTCFAFFLILTLVHVHHCGRYGGSRSSSRGSYSRPSYSRPSTSYHAPSYHAPSPSYHAPSPSYHAPSPSYHVPSPSYHAPSYQARPSPPPRTRPSSRPNPPAYEPPARTATSKPLQSSYTSRPSTARPYHHVASSSRPIGPPTSRPYQPISTSRYRPVQSVTQRPSYVPPRTSRRPYYSGTTARPRYSTARSVGWGNNPNAGWNLPPRPGSGPIGPSYNGPQKIKIVNKYNYHYPGHYSLPVYQTYPGYYHTPSYYHYSTGDTGSTAFGFFLGYGLGRLTTPTYSHHTFYDGYRPRYDHYEVHHYYHNRDSVPQRQEIRPNNIIGCVGDSSSICPVNTTSLCTSSGTLMCVTAIAATTPCADNPNNKCVTSTISCVNNSAPECKNSNQQATTVSIPCVSNAEIHGDLKTVNNTIIPANATLPAPVSANTTVNNNTSTLNGTSVNSTNIVNGTNANANSTIIEVSTKYPITTTPEVPPHRERRKRQVPQNYCVTVVAVPAKRQSTEGEQFLEDAKFIAGKFFESAFNF